MKMFYISFLVLLTINIIVQESNGQDLISWADYGEMCAKEGAMWIISQPCKSYNGTVECKQRVGLEEPEVGKCECNLGGYAYFDTEQKACLGLVGAICTAEKTNLIPGKQCTPNADCFPISDGDTVGKCDCLYGYQNVNGRCVEDPGVDDNDRSTRRPTTTTQAPDKGNIKLPPLDMLIGNVVEFGLDCNGRAFLPLLNRTHCKLHQMTTACVSKTCGCNMGADDAHFDQELQQCVALAGSYCLTRKNAVGWKACTAGADCFLEDGLGENHSFGTCECMYGYNELEDGTCERDEEVSNPSTRGTGGPPIPTSSTVPTRQTGTTPQGTRTTPQGTRTTPQGTGTTPDATQSTTEGAGQMTATFSIIVMSSVVYFLSY